MTATVPLVDVTIALTLAFAGGLIARLLNLPTISGFLLAGVVISPFTPGYVANAEVLHLMAELGVVMLLFGVGLHFKLEHLVAVRAVAVPGAILQIAVSSGLGVLIGTRLGLTWEGALVFGLAGSIASTVVLTRTLEARGMLDAAAGRLAIGWLVVQDLAMVLVLALIPALAGGPTGEVDVGGVALVVLQAGLFLALMLYGGARVLPALLRYVEATGSRELFILAIVSIALSIATGGTYFGVSVALGAFVAGLAVSEAQTTRIAADEVLPLREAFAALFFVSVGMLLDPAALAASPALFLGVVGLVVVNAATAYAVVSFARGGSVNAPIVAAGLAQVGEFSFIIAEVGSQAGLLPAEAYNAVLGAAVVTIALNPLAFQALARLRRPQETARVAA